MILEMTIAGTRVLDDNIQTHPKSEPDESLMVGASDYRGLRFEYLLTCQPDCKFYLVIFSSPFLFTNELIPSVLDSHLLHLQKHMLELQWTLSLNPYVSEASAMSAGVVDDMRATSPLVT